MSIYTTGEVAKLCHVSVRTVQYYDTRGILIPTELSEGGRRLYSEADVKKMRVICFLRELGLPINSIGELLSEKDPGSVIDLLLEQQKQALQQEISERQTRLDLLERLQRELKNVEHFSVESIGDVARIMTSKQKLRKIRTIMLLTGIPVALLQWTSILLWIFTGIWWLFVVWACVAIPYGILISRYYFKNVAYICPQCHEVFKPAFKEAFFAPHTPSARKLTCPHCGHKGYCVETCADNKTV